MGCFMGINSPGESSGSQALHLKHCLRAVNAGCQVVRCKAVTDNSTLASRIQLAVTPLPFPSPPSLLLHPPHIPEASAIVICLACISLLHHLAWLAVLPQEAPLSRVIALVGSAALPSLILCVRARWRPSFHFLTPQLCSCATTDNCEVVARAKQKHTQLWNRRTALHKPGTTTLGPTLHSRLPACTLWPIHVHTQGRKRPHFEARLTSQLPRDLQRTRHGARAQTEQR